MHTKHLLLLLKIPAGKYNKNRSTATRDACTEYHATAHIKQENERTLILGAYTLINADNGKDTTPLLTVDQLLFCHQVSGELAFGSLNVIGIDGGKITIHKRTNINNFTERLGCRVGIPAYARNLTLSRPHGF